MELWVRNYKYILEGHTPVLCKDLEKWEEWMKKGDRTVKKTKEDNVEVRTVFVALGPPQFNEAKTMLFETMVVGGKHDREQECYHTWEEAEIGHAAMVKKVFKEN